MARSRSPRGGSTVQGELWGDSHFVGQALVEKPAYIVLQERSAGPSLHRTHRWVLAVAVELGAEVVYYQTWHVGFGADYQTSVDTLNGYTPSIGLALLPAGRV